ncbi:MAG: RNA polymerase sigma-54 factor, partial [Clostridia bacterium]|nr:RNA polymerase sigma-54 factor [Clostridia bacterium]
MGLGLNLEQTQKLVMTPELRQAIVILQLSALELDQYIQQAMMENPVLEMNEEIPELAEEATASADEDGPGFELDWQEYFDDSTDLGVVRYPREEYEGYSWENFLAQAPTLHEYLLLQLQLAVSEGKKKEIGE